MTAITRDEVWEMFREVARRLEESDRKLTQRFEETNTRNHGQVQTSISPL